MRRQIQEAASKIPESVFYRELLSSMKEQIETDAKLYFTWAYDEYMKTPGAAPEKFRTYLAKAYSEHEKTGCALEPRSFKPFPDRNGPTLTSVEYTVTPDGVYANPFNENYRVNSDDHRCCEFQFNYGKHGYSNLSQVQVWALAQTLGRDLGYRMACFRESRNCLDDWSCKEDTYRKKIEENPGREYYIDLEPEGKTGYLAQVVESEIRRVQASGVSYRSPF